MQHPADIRDLLNLHPFSENISSYISSLAASVSSSNTTQPEVKSYSDAVYFNYFALGLSLLFTPSKGYKPTTGLRLSELKSDKLILESIDMYNVPKRKPSEARPKSTSSRAAELAFSTYPVSPIILTIPTVIKDKDGKALERPSKLEVLPETTGKDFVQCLGEPDRKGGGTGPSSGSIGIWCDWPKDGIMVEFGGDEAKGPQAWERGKDAVWKVITIFCSG